LLPPGCAGLFACPTCRHGGGAREAPRAAQAAGAIAALAAERGGDAEYASPYSQQAQRQGLDLPWWQKLAGASLRDGRLELGALRVRSPWSIAIGSRFSLSGPMPERGPRAARPASAGSPALQLRRAGAGRAAAATARARGRCRAPAPCLALCRVVGRARGRTGTLGVSMSGSGSLGSACTQRESCR